ncbi:MAG TPA: flagellar hook capping FlgD N-terminal domain-containing protein [Bacteroidota bacterium]|nr:flagellar hook capping FlgD N-terminal domain-containing protein [Bacteroidota bacterium]
MSTTSAIGSTATAASATAAANKNILGKDDFLKLLIQQLKYQDPLNPMNGAEYAAQLAQFSSVEQLSNINDSLKVSIDANYLLSQSVNNTLSASLIGKDVKLSASTFAYDGKTDVSLGYTLPGAVGNVAVDVYNDKGEVVRELKGGDLSAGDHEMTWDGKNDAGVQMTDGKYTFKVKAVDDKGSAVTANQFIWGTIDSVRFTTQGTVVVINKTEIPLSNILEVGGKRG